MLRTRDDIFTEFLVRNSRTTSDAFLTEAMLKNWFTQGNIWAASQHKWPFTEGRVSTTFATAGGPAADEWYFEGYKADSFRILQIGGKRVRKLNFEDYQIFREEESSADDRVWSDYGRTVFINPNIDLSGTLTAWGQYQPAIDITDETGLTVFSDWDQEGNEAIVQKMTEYLKKREGEDAVGEQHGLVARAKLDEIWQRILDEQHKYQTHTARGGQWKRIDVLEGGYTEEILKRDQF